MQIEKFDFAAKAAALKAQSIALETEYSQPQRAHWLTQNALHYAYGSLAGAANKLETAPQDSELVFSLIRTVVDQIAAVEQLLADIDIEKVNTDPFYAGSQLNRARVARESAQAVDQLAAAIAKVVSANNELTQKNTRVANFVEQSQTKKRFAVVKSDFTHTKGGMPSQLHKGWHCDIDNEMPNGDMRIGAGDVSIYFTADEVARLFDIVEA